MSLLWSMLLFQWTVLNCLKRNRTNIVAFTSPAISLTISGSIKNLSYNRCSHRLSSPSSSSSSSFCSSTMNSSSSSLHQEQPVAISHDNHDPNSSDANASSSSSSNNLLMTNQEKKRFLRKTIRSKLTLMTREEISRQSHAVWEKVFQLPQYQSSQSVGLFLSMPTGEIHTYSACERVLSDGKTLYLPRVGLDFEKCDMELVRVSSSSSSLPGQLERRSVVDDGQVNVGCSSNSNIISTASVSFYETWPRNKWGIPEPLSSKGDDDIAKSGDIDFMIVPGLGFDRFGGRLGQGKGYYDRFLSKMMLTSNNTNDIQIHKPFLVAVGLEPCLVSDEEGIPMSPHDFRMDMVILPNVVLDCDRQSS